MSEFGSEIKNIRNKKGLSLKDVAKRGGMSHSYLSQIENRRRNPPKPEIINKIALGLGEDHNDLMELAGYISRATSIQSETEELQHETEEIKQHSEKLESQLKIYASLKKQEKMLEILKDLNQSLSSDLDLYYKEKLLTKEDKDKLLTIIQTLLD